MALRRWEPFGGLERLRSEMDRIFDDFFPTRLLRTHAAARVRVPAVDLKETETEITLKADLPGVKKENLDVQVTPEAVTLKSESSEEKEEKGEGYYCRERAWGGFERTIPLPVEVKADKAKAKFADGVLEITIPKSEAARAVQPHKVAVE
jgi:HSP20 family protein